MNTDFKSLSFPTNCPELKFNPDGTSNWDEVEKFLYCHSLEYQKCSQLANHLKLYDIDKYRIVIEFFFRINDSLKEMLVKEIKNSPIIFTEKDPHR